MMAANTSNFPPEKYIGIASNHLVVYAIYSLYKDGDEISAEDIISACFILFPKKFSLRTYPQWPDSALIGRRLHDCEKNGWLTARIDIGFKLTALGNKLAEKVARELGVEIPKKEKPKVHKLRVDKLRITGEPDVKRSALNVEKTEEKQVDKSQPPETAEPAPVTTKPAEEPKPAEKVVASVAKAVEAPKSEEKRQKQKQVDKLQVAETVKPAPVKPKVEKAREKRVDKLQVTEAVKPAPIVEPVVTKQKPAEKAKAPAVKAPKPAEKKVAAPVAKPAPVKPKVEKAKEKRVAEVKVTEAVKPAPVAKPAPVKPKVEKAKEKRVAEVKVVEAVKLAPVAKPTPVKLKVEKAREKRVDKVQVTEAVKPAPIAKPKPKAPVVAVQKPLFQIPAISAEEKAKAGKYVKMMEGSDAYRLYKKNGANANIGEFDFRSLLLCTMESSHETLARNVELFKGYAEIHNRQDLVTFLTVCKDKFAHLLAPEKKAVRKLR